MENYERTPYAGWCPTQLLPWIQNQDLKKLIVFGIGMILVTGKLARIDLKKYIFLSFYSCFQELLFFWAWESWSSLNQPKMPLERFLIS